MFHPKKSFQIKVIQYVQSITIQPAVKWFSLKKQVKNVEHILFFPLVFCVALEKNYFQRKNIRDMYPF